MNDLISKTAVIEILSTMQGRCDTKAALVQNSKIWQQVKDMPTVEAIPVSYFASELAEIKLILQHKGISKTYREELEAEKRYLVGWINNWRWETGRGCRGWAFQPLSDDEIASAERKEE